MIQEKRIPYDPVGSIAEPFGLPGLSQDRSLV